MKFMSREENQLVTKIQEIRDCKIILDVDLAKIYGVPTKRLNEQVKRNKQRFPRDFVFQLSREELLLLNPENNRSQFATSSQKHRASKFRPYAFTEHGAIMTAQSEDKN